MVLNGYHPALFFFVFVGSLKISKRGVCLSDMIPFYLGKLFRQSGASDDVCSKVIFQFKYVYPESWLFSTFRIDTRIFVIKLGIGKEKALSITQAVQKYGNLSGFGK